MALGSGHTRAWVTLVTADSYIPGVIILAHTLEKHETRYPLIVLITPSLSLSSVSILQVEASRNPLLSIKQTAPLLPLGHENFNLIATRFADTWTKLRVFELTSYEAIIFLDADITIFRNMDHAFDIKLPGSDWLAANHACVCNLDHDSWAPLDWNAGNCAYTPLRHPSALKRSTPVPHTSDVSGKRTYRLLNGGMFLFHPSAELWSSMLHEFETSSKLQTYMFPDQDFIADFFGNRWVSLGWQYNALKTMRYWHENIWRDEEVCALHYIVDKPWQKPIASDGIAGYLGRDGGTHSWWWNLWEEWRRARLEDKSFVGRGLILKEMVMVADLLVASPLDEIGNTAQCNENSKKGFPIPVPDHPGKLSNSFNEVDRA
ncbi:MAG: hypothetical protein MMC33_010774 [Icmadophila ericetorum]|nr:hypothetical protein [Icmadophila ericetorum]